MYSPTSQQLAAAASSRGASKFRRSHLGATLTSEKAIADGVAVATSDTLRVAPLEPGEELWNWVQPLLSTGGHIIGAPSGNLTTSTPAQAMAQAAKVGDRILYHLYQGNKFRAHRPEHSLAVLAALAKPLSERNASLARELSKKLARVIQYASEPDVDVDLGTRYDERFLAWQTYSAAVDVLEQVDLDAILAGDQEAPSWKEIKSMPVGGCISNQMARMIRRQMVSVYAKKKRVWRLAALRTECTTPLSGGPPVLDYVDQCWSLRTSSISSHLTRRPPAIVTQSLGALGFTASASDEFSQRALILSKFQVFREWVECQHGPGSTPVVWSDTLSKFANAINPHVNKYNQSVEQRGGSKADLLLRATSFVPGDLAPEMYSGSSSRYFFHGGGWYYKYSDAWRSDAFLGLYQKRLPPSVVAKLGRGFRMAQVEATVSPRLAYQGGQELLRALERAGVSELQAMRFLQAYYFSGAFLYANLGLDVR